MFVHPRAPQWLLAYDDDGRLVAVQVQTDRQVYLAAHVQSEKVRDAGRRLINS